MHIYWGFHQKLGASGGTWSFLGLKLEQYFGNFQYEKIFKFKIFSSCDKVLTYTMLINNRKNFYPTNL